MLSLILRSNKVYYLDWSVTEHIPVINDCGVKKFTKNLYSKIEQLDDFFMHYLEKSRNKEVSLVLDESHVLLSCHKNVKNIDTHFIKRNIQKINFGENKDYFSSNFYNLGIDGQHMIGLHLQSSLKEKIIKYIGSKGLSIHSLSVGIFSGMIGLKSLSAHFDTNNTVVLKFDFKGKNNAIYINKNVALSYLSFTFKRKKFNILQQVGDDHDIEIMINNIMDLIKIKPQKKNDRKLDILVYQKDSSYDYKDFLKNKKNMFLYNPIKFMKFDKLTKSELNNIKFMPFAEIGISLEGIDV